LLSIRGLAKRYGPGRGRSVFEGVDLDVAAGEYVAIMGESGVGKSTLLNLVAGLDDADAGRIEFDGVELGALDDDRRTLLRRERMGFVFQAFHILPHLDLEQNVALPLTLAGAPRAECLRRAQAMLAEVGLGERAHSMPRELSGGELQRVAIARALVGRPRLVLADEPTGNLDADNARAVLALLRDAIRSHRAAGLLVTHSPRAARTADRILALQRDGLVAGMPAAAAE
jgi:putative ABC transport system ATP-binding protein